jgi:hypothetical protein
MKATAGGARGISVRVGDKGRVYDGRRKSGGGGEEEEREESKGREEARKNVQ